MALYYIPNLGACRVINSSYIRVYDTLPRNNSSSSYTDYYFNSHYVGLRGSQSWGANSTLPTCNTIDNFTTNVFYRFDIDSVLITFLIILLICFWFPYKILARMFGRWLKL